LGDTERGEKSHTSPSEERWLQSFDKRQVVIVVAWVLNAIGTMRISYGQNIKRSAL